jgi:hypothetical protein
VSTAGRTSAGAPSSLAGVGRTAHAGTMGTGRGILRAVAGATAVGGFAADWNRTHLFNPGWPPHARFHDAMTISLGAVLGAAALYLLRDGADRRDVVLGAVAPAVFWASMESAFAYPGTAGMRAEFPELVPRVGGVWLDEKVAGAVMLAATAVGYGLEVRHRRRR